MRIKFTFALLVLIGFASCKSNTKISIEKPHDLIEKDKMVDVLYDMALVSAAKGVNRRLLEREGVVPDEYIYEKYSIDSVIFSESNTYYSHDIIAYDAMYTSVRLRIEKMRDSLNLKIAKDKVVKDSLSIKTRRERDSLLKLGKDKPKRRPVQPKRKPESMMKKVDSSVQLKHQAP